MPFASIVAYEAGAACAGNVRETTIVARSVFFQTVVDEDLIFDETAGRNVLGFGTTRSGWVGALRLTGRFFDESANLTLVRAAFNDNHQAVAYVPGTVLRSDFCRGGAASLRSTASSKPSSLGRQKPDKVDPRRLLHISTRPASSVRQTPGRA